MSAKVMYQSYDVSFILRILIAKTEVKEEGIDMAGRRGPRAIA
jgi:hypothetical protein